MKSLNRTAVLSFLVGALACYASWPLEAMGETPHLLHPSPRVQNHAAREVDSIPGNSYEVQELAAGIYAAIRRVDAGTADGNTMFIINESDVIVVDTGMYPTSARQMIGEIRKRTDKPVRYIINTHWHFDHLAGNQTFLEAYPGAEIISHPATRDLASSKGPFESTAPAFQAEIANIDKQLKSGKSSDGEPLTPERRKHMELAKSDFEFWIKDTKGYRVALPTITVADSLVLRRGERTIEVKYLGEGHTPGDLVVYLPKEHIVETGDLVVYPVPFGGATNMKDWPATLRALRKLDATTIVPGHGEVQHDWTYVDRQIALIESTWEQVDKAVNAGADLDAVKKQVNGSALSMAFGATSPKDRDDFDYTYLDSAIEAAFKELRPDSVKNK